MNHVKHLLNSADISIFSPEISQFCYIKKHRYRFHLDIYFLTLLTFLEFLRMVLINMVKILMMPAKMATPGLLKINIFWKKAYDVIIFAHDATNTISSRHSNIMYIWSCDPSLVTLAFLWKKLSYTQFYKDLTRKSTFFEGWSCFQLNNYGLALGTDLKLYKSVAKGLTLKVRKFWGLISTFAEITEEKLVGGGRPFSPPPPQFLNRVK